VIDPTAVVGPYAVLGSDTVIGPAAHVRHAVLWDHVRIDAGARVSESILASNVHVGREAVVQEGAVVGQDASIEPGTVLEPDARVSASMHDPEEAVAE
jgi:NDP-sugar pyrophosphorylase family protein